MDSEPITRIKRKTNPIIALESFFRGDTFLYLTPYRVYTIV